MVYKEPPLLGCTGYGYYGSIAHDSHRLDRRLSGGKGIQLGHWKYSADFSFFYGFNRLLFEMGYQIRLCLVTGMNLIREIPLAGQFILSMVIGGPDMAENRLLHLYAWHIAGLPFILFLFMVYHIYRIRRDGGISSENSDIEKITIPREILLEREIIFILISLSALIILSAFFHLNWGLHIIMIL
jgi:hypothetical protein